MLFSRLAMAASQKESQEIDLPAKNNLVSYWDAANLESWPGSGGQWKNLVNSPADGSSQTAYDLNVGSASGSNPCQPTFSGAPGGMSANEFWNLTPSTGFSLENNTPFVNGMHHSNSAWTIAYIMFISSQSSSYLTTTLNAGSTNNRGIVVYSGFTQVIATGGYPLGYWSPAPGFNVLTSSWDGTESIDPFKFSIDSSVTVPSVANSVSDTSSQADRSLLMFFQNGFVNGFPTGSKAYVVCLWNKVLSDVEIAEFYNAFSARYGY